MHRNIPTVAGLKTRFICSIIGQADSKLAGYVIVDGERHAMELSNGDTLIAPITPSGDYLYEIRSSGTVVVWGHLCARPSAFPPEDDITTIGINADMGADNSVVHLNIVFPQGPPGERGPQGEPGRDGVAPTAEDVAAALIPMISSKMTFEGPAGTYNWHANYFMLGETYVPEDSALVELGYRVRFDSIAGCTTDPVYLGVWERAENGVDWELRGVSLNTQVQAQSSDMLWLFDPSKVRLSGRPIRCCLMATQEDGWRTDLTMGMRTADVAAANTAIFLNDQTWQKAPKFFLTAYKTVAVNIGGGGSDEGHDGKGERSTQIGTRAEASGNYSLAAGYQARAKGSLSTAVGAEATAKDGSTAVGSSASADGISSTALGRKAKAKGDGSFAIGEEAYMEETGCGVLTTSNYPAAGSANVFTNLILIGAQTSVAEKYTGGEAGLGFIVKVAAGPIIKRGCIRLSELCREHTDDFELSEVRKYE